MPANPGQVSPSEELEELLKQVRSWFQRHYSEDGVFGKACWQVKCAADNIDNARRLLVDDERK